MQFMVNIEQMHNPAGRLILRNVPFAVWRLMLAYSLMMAGVSVLVLIAGIIGTDIAPSEGLATMPLALGVIGVASLSSGWVLYVWKWQGVLWACVPLVLAFLVLLSLSRAPVERSLADEDDH